jgi:hypothetical protein
MEGGLINCKGFGTGYDLLEEQSQHLPRDNEERHKNLSSDSCCPSHLQSVITRPTCSAESIHAGKTTARHKTIRTANAWVWTDNYAAIKSNNCPLLAVHTVLYLCEHISLQKIFRVSWLISMKLWYVDRVCAHSRNIFMLTSNFSNTTSMRTWVETTQVLLMSDMIFLKACCINGSHVFWNGKQQCSENVNYSATGQIL